MYLHTFTKSSAWVHAHTHTQTLFVVFLRMRNEKQRECKSAGASLVCLTQLCLGSIFHLFLWNLLSAFSFKQQEVNTTHFVQPEIYLNFKVFKL